MSALTAARHAAERATAALREAETKAAAEASAVAERNAKRRVEFWADAGQRCEAAQLAADARLEAARALVADGKASAGLDEYVMYRLQREAWARIAQLAQNATQHYVDDNGDAADPTAHRARRRFAAGVPSPSQAQHEAVPWATMLEDGLRRAQHAYGAEFVRDYLAPLNDSLEPEQ